MLLINRIRKQIEQINEKIRLEKEHRDLDQYNKVEEFNIECRIEEYEVVKKEVVKNLKTLEALETATNILDAYVLGGE